MKTKYANANTCKYCQQDIEFHGKLHGWLDRGGNRGCCAYLDPKTKEFVKPKTKHKPFTLA